MAGKIIPEPLPFEEAIEYFADKVPMTKAELAKLAEESRSLAFTVATEQKMELITGVKSAVEKALEEGTTLEQFRKDLASLFDAQGVTPLGKFHAETVFRTNIQTAYNVGRYKQMTHPDVLKERPYLEYDAVDDTSTRPEHAALDGKVYPADDPFWDTWYPPNGYNCRCRANSVSPEEVEAEGLKVETEAPAFYELPNGTHAPLIPSEGFGSNPATSAGYKPDWSKYPAELRREAGV